MNFFPFLNNTGELTRDIIYMYSLAYQELQFKIPGYANGSMKCMYFGSETDKFRIAINW
jgi:hypothetical protein